jgi:hypothetical protein
MAWWSLNVRPEDIGTSEKGMSFLLPPSLVLMLWGCSRAQATHKLKCHIHTGTHSRKDTHPCAHTLPPYHSSNA